jgi:beta-lactamase regulating signal transducer with metallopeptidase domain
MLWWLGQNLLVATMLACLVALVCRLARPAPALCHAMWLLVLLKLLTPPVVYWPWPVPGLSRLLPASTDAVETDASPVNEQLAAQFQALLALQHRQASDQASGPMPATPAREQTVWAASAAGWLLPLALGIWCTGTVLMAGLHALRIRRFRRLLEQAQWPPSWLKQQVRELARRLQVRRPRTQVIPHIDSPSVWSLGRPRLLWPEALLDTLPAGCRRSVVVHELAHLRRRDHWVGWLLLSAECLWWWNPLFWFVRRQIRASAEMACDAWVVQTLPDDRRAYAEALLEVTELVSRTVAPVPALGMSTGARHLFERRLTMIMREPVSCRPSIAGLAGLVVLAFLALPCWSLVQTARAEDPRSEQKPDPEPERVLVFKFQEQAKPEQVLVFKFQGPEKQADKGIDAVRERRLRALEDQIRTLLKEVEALRGGGQVAGKRQVKVITKDQVLSEDLKKLDELKKLKDVQVQVLSEDLKNLDELKKLKGVQVQVLDNQQRVLILRDADKGDRTITVKPVEPNKIEKIVVKPVDPNKNELRMRMAVPDQKQEAVRLYVRTLDATSAKQGTTNSLDKKGKPEQGGTAAERGVHYLRLHRVDVGSKESIQLVRATYRLPHEKAEALASLLKQLVNAPVMETNVDGDVLTVTTTPEAQKPIQALIGLIEGKKSAAAEGQKPLGLILEGKLDATKVEPGLLDEIQRNELKPLDKVHPKSGHVDVIELKSLNFGDLKLSTDPTKK